MRTNKIVYWGATGLLSVLMIVSTTMYFVKYNDIILTFGKLGFPSWIIYPLAVAKLLGLIAIITKKSEMLKEWAYAGFFFNFILAFSAHISINDREFVGALIALILLVLSYVFEKKMNSNIEN